MKKLSILLIAGIIICSGLLSGCFQEGIQTTKMSVNEIKQSTHNISYDELMRNNDNYKGTIVYFRGQIVQVIEGYDNDYDLRVSTKFQGFGMYYDNEIYLNYKGTRLLKDDIIDLWGYVKGLKTYTSILGAEITIPELDAFHIEIIKKAGE